MSPCFYIYSPEVQKSYVGIRSGTATVLTFGESVTLSLLGINTWVKRKSASRWFLCFIPLSAVLFSVTLKLKKKTRYAVSTSARQYISKTRKCSVLWSGICGNLGKKDNLNINLNKTLSLNWFSFVQDPETHRRLHWFHWVWMLLHLHHCLRSFNMHYFSICQLRNQLAVCITTMWFVWPFHVRWLVDGRKDFAAMRLFVAWIDHEHWKCSTKA